MIVNKNNYFSHLWATMSGCKNFLLAITLNFIERCDANMRAFHKYIVFLAFRTKFHSNIGVEVETRESVRKGGHRGHVPEPTKDKEGKNWKTKRKKPLFVPESLKNLTYCPRVNSQRWVRHYTGDTYTSSLHFHSGQPNNQIFNTSAQNFKFFTHGAYTWRMAGIRRQTYRITTYFLFIPFLIDNFSEMSVRFFYWIFKRKFFQLACVYPSDRPSICIRMMAEVIMGIILRFLKRFWFLCIMQGGKSESIF